MHNHKFNNRIIVLDTETTGLSPQEGHRIIEIGCVEMINRRPTGKHFHVYLNPGREIDDGAVAVHGITNSFLADKPKFAEVYRDFLGFIQTAELVIHNAPFDVGFLNHELRMQGQQQQVEDLCAVFDTLAFARKKHPGQRNSLDALCKRYGIDNSHRDLHGALLDAQILADVFLLMTGGQASLLDENTSGSIEKSVNSAQNLSLQQRTPLTVIACTEAELAAHEQSLAAIEKSGGICLWTSN